MIQKVETITCPPSHFHMSLWAEDGWYIVAVVYDPEDEDFKVYLQEVEQ